jgi:hypothetical protein
MYQLGHHFDLSLSMSEEEFMMEEVHEAKQYVSDCLASASSLSTVACSTVPSSVGSFSSVGSVVSCG